MMRSLSKDEKEPKDDVLETHVIEAVNSASGESLEYAPRKKRPAQCYFMFMAVVYLLLLITAIVALASFEIKEAEVMRLNSEGKLLTLLDQSRTCILFGENVKPDDVHELITNLGFPGVCGYVLWGLISVTIVAFVWLIYNVVLAAIGPKIISLPRLIDFLMMFLTVLLSLSLSITITAGLKATCSKLNDKCATLGYVQDLDHPFETAAELEYYQHITTAQWSSWVATIILSAVSIWYFATIVGYFFLVSRRRRMAQYTHFEDMHNGEN